MEKTLLPDCPHRIAESSHGLHLCALGPAVRCETCVEEWTDGRPPSRDRPTPFLAALGVKPPARPPSWSAIFLSALRAFRQFVASGGAILDPEASAARLRVCAGCDHRGRALARDVCRRCGCFVELKARLPAEHCPAGKWPGDPPASQGCGSCGDDSKPV